MVSHNPLRGLGVLINSFSYYQLERAAQSTAGIDKKIAPPGIYHLGAKASTYQPAPCNAPPGGSKRRRQWR